MEGKILKTIIVEDEIDAQLIIRKYLTDNYPTIEIIAVTEDFDSAKTAIEEMKPDFIFLDVNLGNKSGIDLANEFQDPKPFIIFTTAHLEFAIEALRMKAVDYLLKPIIKSEFILAVNRVYKQIEETKEINEYVDAAVSPKITVATQEGKHIVDIEDISHIEAGGAYCSIYFNNGRKKMIISKPLNHFCKQLESMPQFFRCHKSFLVNMGQVDFIKTAIKTEVVLKDKTKIPVSRSKKSDLHATLIKITGTK